MTSPAVSEAGGANESVNVQDVNVVQISDKHSLIWIRAMLPDQELPAMIDTGANPNCISLHCVQGSEMLNGLERYRYLGKQIVGESGHPCKRHV